MIKNQATGYEAEIWREVDDGDKFVAAGDFDQCKIYVTMQKQKGIDMAGYYIVSRGNQIILCSDEKGSE